jgi:hypothetical protein
MTFSKTNEKQFFADMQERITKLEKGLRQVPLNNPNRGGGGGTGLIIARIIGGNAAVLTGSDDPLGRLFLHSVPYSNPNGVLFETPSIDDWVNYQDLDSTFVIGGSKIPLQPSGIGFAQIVRPYSLGSAKWSNNDTWVVLTSGNPVINVANINPDKKTITLTGNKTDIVKATTPNITVTVDGVLVTIQSISATASGAKIVLQAVADITKPIVVTWDDSAFIQGEVPVPAGNLSVSSVGDYYTIVRVLNNTGSQGFSFGSYVILDKTETSVTDDKNVSKTCYRVIGPASQAIPHNHSGLGTTGQGKVQYIL